MNETETNRREPHVTRSEFEEFKDRIDHSLNNSKQFREQVFPQSSIELKREIEKSENRLVEALSRTENLAQRAFGHADRLVEAATTALKAATEMHTSARELVEMERETREAWQRQTEDRLRTISARMWGALSAGFAAVLGLLYRLLTAGKL